ncbi:MAG: leucine dehydrogenase [Coxiella sp. RIFCSPHIGHO2_12_FULL_42_15]|nr:MAG: leucine dehydrogenase [Coxiella sp. RIFCSPHIGHO2_12_FULL_42_15]
MSTSLRKHKQHTHEALMRYARMLGFGEIRHRIDPKSKLQSIIAVHNTIRGPAIGGCRFYAYRFYSQALKDVLRLASMMTVKNAACGLPHGGAKAVIMTPRENYDRKTLFNAFGDFVNELDGKYITAMDVGTTNQDMDYIAERTTHVIGALQTDALQENPSPYTAKGILRCIQAAVKFKYQRDSLEGLKFAIQGAGNVGFSLAKYLFSLGGKIYVCDTNPTVLEQLADETHAIIVSTEHIYDVDCHVFSPCALGGILTFETAHRLRCNIIIGSANNQLAHRKVGALLHERGILYGPDFIVNAGGVIQAASVYDYHDINIANQKIDKLYDQLYKVFERSKQQQVSPVDVAYQMAFENLNMNNGLNRGKL